MKKIRYCVAVYYDNTLDQYFVEAKSDSAAVKKAVLMVRRYHSELVDWTLDLNDAYLDVVKLLKEKGFIVNCIQVS